MGFATLELAKKILRIPDEVTKDDMLIQAAVDAANAELLAYFCLSQCAPTQYNVACAVPCVTRRLPSIRIAPYPVISVDAATLFGSDLDAAEDFKLINGSFVRFCSRSCYRCGCPKCGSDDCTDFTATVTAGFATVPPQLAMGVSQLAANYYNSGDGSMKSERIGRYQYERFGGGQQVVTHAPAHWPPMLAGVILPYRRFSSMLTAQICP